MKIKPQRCPLSYGDPILFMDRRRREFFAILKEGKISNINGDVLEHDLLIGQADGSRLDSKKGNAYRVFRTTMQQYALNMPRFATIIYPKDIGAILMQADIFPGAKVVEGGLGSGAMAMAMLRAIGPAGHLTTYEIRQDSLNCGQKNISVMLGEVENHAVHLADIYAGIQETDVDRIVLDVPEPWQVVPHAVEALVDGGLFAAYLPTILQVHELIKTLRDNPAFYSSYCIELLERPWHVTEESVRPEQRMVAHTGFLVFSRRSARWPDPPEPVNEEPEA